MARRRRLTPAQPGYNPEQDPPRSAAPAMAPIAPIAQVSGQSAEAAALREMAEGLQTAREEGRMILDVPLSDISPSHLLRDRLVLDREELDTLKASIRTHGQRMPAELVLLTPETLRFARETGAQPGGDGEEGRGVPAHRFGLVSGWRRLTVLSELFAETGDLRFSVLRAVLRPAEESAASYVAMIEENEIRVGLSYYERARAVAELTAQGVFADQSSALRSLFGAASRAKRSKIGSFIQIYEAFGDQLCFPTAIPERLGLALVSRLRLGGAAVQHEIRRALDAAAPQSAEAEITVLERLARPRPPAGPRGTDLVERLRPGLDMKVRRQGKGISVTFSGDQIDEAFLDHLRGMLRASDG